MMSDFLREEGTFRDDRLFFPQLHETAVEMQDGIRILFLCLGVDHPVVLRNAKPWLCGSEAGLIPCGLVGFLYVLFTFILHSKMP